MLGYSEVFCTTSNAQFDRVDNEVPIWMSDLSCRGTEEYLDDCEFYGWGPEEHDCTSHSSDAGVVCRNGRKVINIWKDYTIYQKVNRLKKN